MPVDHARQDKLRTYLESEEERIAREVQLLVPEELLPLNRKEGYKSLPKDLRARLKELELITPKAKLDYYMVNHYDVIQALGYVEVEDIGLVKRLEFNPTSAQQLLAYIRYMDYRVPLDIDSGKPTTNKEELQKLIDETSDEVLKLAQKSKKVSKLKGTYVNGDWIPGPDGRVHGQFRFGTAVGQTSCTGPNQQQFPQHFDPEDAWVDDIGKEIKGTIVAQPGHIFVKIDAKGAHSRMQAFLAEDADYYRLSNIGTHAFNTAHYVKVPDRDSLLAMDDSLLAVRLKEIKKRYDYEYNFVKRTSFLMQYLGGPEKAAYTLRVPVVEVVALMELIKGTFPKSFKDFPKSVTRRIKHSPRLISAHGACRWFWDQDERQAVAFAVSNEFHCHWQSGLVRLHESGLLDKYEAVNFCHDDLWLHPKEELKDECIAEVRAELEKPSDILVNSLGHFQVGTETQIGYNMAELGDA